MRALLPSADIVHLATHGCLHPVRAMASSVLLAAPAQPLGSDAAGSDGMLQAWEIVSQLQLRASLVVLSACETGRRRRRRQRGDRGAEPRVAGGRRSGRRGEPLEGQRCRQHRDAPSWWRFTAGFARGWTPRPPCSKPWPGCVTIRRRSIPSTGRRFACSGTSAVGRRWHLRLMTTPRWSAVRGRDVLERCAPPLARGGLFVNSRRWDWRPSRRRGGPPPPPDPRSVAPPAALPAPSVCRRSGGGCRALPRRPPAALAGPDGAALWFPRRPRGAGMTGGGPGGRGHGAEKRA